LREIITTAIQAMSTAGVIPSKESIAEQVAWCLRQPLQEDTNGEGLLAKSLGQCKTIEAIVQHVGFNLTTNDDGVTIIQCPVCIITQPNRCTFKVAQTLTDFRKAVSRHILSNAHMAAHKARVAEEARLEMHKNTGLTMGRLALQTLREAGSYKAFERKVVDAYLYGVRVGSINHSTEFISKLVPCMYAVTVERIKRYLHRTDPLTGKKQVFAVNADKATELHRTGQAIGAITFEDGVLKAIFL
jgi:hypothetical protein